MSASLSPAREAYCAIDFGTSNSAIAIAAPGGGSRLVELEEGQPTMPTSVLCSISEEPSRLFIERISRPS